MISRKENRVRWEQGKDAQGWARLEHDLTVGRERLPRLSCDCALRVGVSTGAHHEGREASLRRPPWEWERAAPETALVLHSSGIHGDSRTQIIFKA